MIKKTGVRILLSLVFVFIFLVPTNVFAEKGKWSFTPYAGVNVATSRDMVASSVLSASGVIVVSDFTMSATFAGTVAELSFDDTHGTSVLTGLAILLGLVALAASIHHAFAMAGIIALISVTIYLI